MPVLTPEALREHELAGPVPPRNYLILLLNQWGRSHGRAEIKCLLKANYYVGVLMGTWQGTMSRESMLRAEAKQCEKGAHSCAIQEEFALNTVSVWHPKRLFKKRRQVSGGTGRPQIQTTAHIPQQVEDSASIQACFCYSFLLGHPGRPWPNTPATSMEDAGAWQNTKTVT